MPRGPLLLPQPAQRASPSCASVSSCLLLTNPRGGWADLEYRARDPSQAAYSGFKEDRVLLCLFPVAQEPAGPGHLPVSVHSQAPTDVLLQSYREQRGSNQPLLKGAKEKDPRERVRLIFYQNECRWSYCSLDLLRRETPSATTPKPLMEFFNATQQREWMMDNYTQQRGESQGGC